MISPATTRVFLVILDQQFTSYNRILTATGLRSTGSLRHHLLKLRTAGLITWDADKKGTIRPLVKIVPPSLTLTPCLTTRSHRDHTRPDPAHLDAAPVHRQSHPDLPAGRPNRPGPDPEPERRHLP